jgi:hypothetical protein
MLIENEIRDFDKNGYVLIPGLLNAEETDLLRRAAHADDTMLNHAFELADKKGARIRLAGWNIAGDDTFGLIARSHRVVDRMEAFFRDDVYHYHSKVILKEPFTGGAWEWHQDYGYWYQNGCFVSRYGQLPDCDRSGNERERMPAGAEGIPPDGPYRARSDSWSNGSGS